MSNKVDIRSDWQKSVDNLLAPSREMEETRAAADQQNKERLEAIRRHILRGGHDEPSESETPARRDY